MLKINLQRLEKMTNNGTEDEPHRHVTGNFALYSAAGTKSGSVVYFELEPDCELGNHTDSAEEIIYVVDGDIEATIGKERDRISKGELGAVPVMESHNFRNVGSRDSHSDWFLF
jgi:quercetin dioxygenase-like cupin family protein